MTETHAHFSESQTNILPEKRDSLQVDVTLLDRLMNLAGELVLSRNQLLQGIGVTDTKAFGLTGQRIDMITSELQEVIMKTRMQPVSTLFDQFNQIVADLGQQYGKSIDLITDGEGAELDKTIIEAIYEPLKCLIEHCIEHRIEKSKERKRAGKSPYGKIILGAIHDAGQLIIILSDDGCGMNHQAVPDVVKAEIENIGGLIETLSKKDRGTDIQIKLPLSQAIIPSQITSVGDERFAIPQTNLSELLRIPSAEIKEKIEKVGNADVVRLRGELLPLINLSDILGVERTYTDSSGTTQPDMRKNLADRRSKKYSTNGKPLSENPPDNGKDLTKRDAADRRNHYSKAVNIAVVFAGNYKYGLVIDQFHDSEEIVIKPLGRHLKKYKSFAGATIMGDGKVALVLDILNLAQIAGLSTIAESKQLIKKGQKAVDNTGERESLVIFKNLETEFFAAPFESIERIERLPLSSIELAGNRKVVQYRGGTLPLFELSQIIDVSPLPKKERQEVIVFRVKDQEFGLMMTPPVDTLEVSLDIDEITLKQKGVKGSMVINNHTTLMLDIPEMAGHFLKEEV